ncbi:tRNA pseudouridine(55) synthase TruB [candidate division WOR-3 bacterium]|uniref:tRNA pseudouridine synthase B n=1 Tax=candidate division WOR-3 bacterium TaxID=2052148 RepID=A0A660SMN5_UNCW3|nr:MAG: tRNA pseudouridine(55) synthase TruB [candidate division WOR-3 bacterium]
MDGFLLVDKPEGVLSSHVINHYRKVLKTKLGHAGTLDPFASGLLVILVGNGTKLSSLVQGMEKEYHGVARFGIVTDTYDPTGRIISEEEKPDLDLKQIKVAMKKFVGEIEQIPPTFSAVKVAGERSYRLARKGVMVKKRPRKVRVYRLETIEFRPPDLHFRAVVGKGCYIRSLIHDLGQMLGHGATLWSLRRVRIGSFSVTDAIALGDPPTLYSLDEILQTLPQMRMSAEIIDSLIQGKSVEVVGRKDGLYFVTDGMRKILGMVKSDLLRTKRVIVQ